jgi:hypothetical protein
LNETVKTYGKQRTGELLIAISQFMKTETKIIFKCYSYWQLLEKEKGKKVKR